MAVRNINEAMRLVIPIYADDDMDQPVAYAHSAPISREIFEANFKLLLATMETTMAAGRVGPKETVLMMRETARLLGDDNPEPVVLREIRQLTNMIMPTATGWEIIPFQEAVDRKLLDEEDAREVLNAAAFFTVAWYGFPRPIRKSGMESSLLLWTARLSSLDCMGFIASLPTSTPAASSGETSTAQPPGTVTVTSQDGKAAVSLLAY